MMKCIVLGLVVTLAGFSAGASTTCMQYEGFFASHNASADDSSEPGSICAGHCCGRYRESHLRSGLHRAAVARVATFTKPVAELLLSTRRTLQEHLLALSQQSQNKTAVLLSQVYRGQESRSHASLASLYEDVRALLRTGPEHDVMESEISTTPPKDMVDSSWKFFRELFPIAYQNVLRLEAKRFTPEYEACLKDAYDSVQPFGDIPKELGSSLAWSLDAARALLQVLATGAGALASSEYILASTSDQCSNRLLRANGCARCRGLDTRPCKNLCLNVARGCIGSVVADLAAPWSDYVEAVERMTRPDADATLRAMDEKVSNAIMHALENHVILEKKVRQECGPPLTLESPRLPATPRPTPGSSRRDTLRAPPPDAELLQFAASLASSKKLFSNLADRLCDADSTHESNEHCWNGDTVGEYTKSLVASSSLADQRYNPELNGVPEDSRVDDVGNRLRKAHQLLVSHTWKGGPAAEAFMQGDEAEEGSGSGGRYPDDDAAYDAEGSGEEGSGQQETESRSLNPKENVHSTTPKTSSASHAVHSVISSVLLFSAVFFTLT